MQRVHKYHRSEKSFSSQLEPKRSEQEHYFSFERHFLWFVLMRGEKVVEESVNFSITSLAL